MGIKEAARDYFRVLEWKEAAMKTKLGDKDYIDHRGYDKALEHYKSIILKEAGE